MSQIPTPKVLVTDKIVRKEAVDMLKKESEVTVIPGLSPEAVIIEAAREVDAILARSATITKNVIEAAPKLKIIARHGVGVDSVDVEEATRRGILITFTPEANAVTVSEFVFSMLLAFSRKIIQGHTLVKEGRWDRAQIIGIELYQKKMGIIGLGNIGSRVSRRARGFEMQVSGYDPYLPGERAKELDIELVSLDDLLIQSDVISLHVRSTPETRGMIGMREFGLMKKEAVLVNTSRGDIMDEEALAAALSDGSIRGACIDTFQKEPLPATSPLRSLDNILLTPHVGGQSVEALIRMGVEAAGNIIKVLKGELPQPIYNPEAIKNALWVKNRP